MTAGRPTKYSQEMIDKAEEYLRTYADSGEEVIPTAAGMSLYLNVNKSTLYEWAKDPNKKFSDMLGKMNEKQERILLTKGLLGEFNSTIAKLVLAKHDYSDKQETTHKGGVVIVPATSEDENL